MDYLFAGVILAVVLYFVWSYVVGPILVSLAVDIDPPPSLEPGPEPILDTNPTSPRRALTIVKDFASLMDERNQRDLARAARAVPVGIILGTDERAETSKGPEGPIEYLNPMRCS